MSLNTMNTVLDFHIMRINGHLGKKTLHILINFSSNHNFLDVNLAKRLCYKIEPITNEAITITNGNQLQR